MNIIDSKTDKELLESLLAELAKASNELRCAKDDIAKIQSRLSFVLAVANTLIKRQGD
jgi:hypothetical protein